MSDLVESVCSWAAERGLVCDRSFAGDVAIFSPDLAYRFLLSRVVGPGSRVVTGVGLNPSTANAFQDDNTIRGMRARAGRWGCGLYLMLNTYAFKATDPADMARARRAGADVVGEYNDAIVLFVLQRLAKNDIALAAWGKPAPADRVAVIRELAMLAGVTWQCLGKNRDGSPRHPLYLPMAAQLESWP